MMVRNGLALGATGLALCAALAGTASAKERVQPQAQAETSAQADWGKVTLSTGVNYSTGKYGQAQSTDIVSVPLIAKVEVDAWTVKLTVPYISVTGPGNVVEGVGVVNGGGGQRSTQSGLGDVTLTVTNTVYDNVASGTSVDVTGKVKFATADADKGLGTGENDYALAIEPAQVVGPVTVFGALGYKVAGDPEGVDLHNVVFASLGGSMKVMEGTSAGLVFDAQTRTSENAPSAQRELTAFATTKLDDGWKAQVYLSRGLAEDSPDWSGGASMSYSF